MHLDSDAAVVSRRPYRNSLPYDSRRVMDYYSGDIKIRLRNAIGYRRDTEREREREKRGRMKAITLHAGVHASIQSVRYYRNRYVHPFYFPFRIAIRRRHLPCI